MSEKQSTLRFYFDTLKLTMPLALAAFTFAIIAFLAVDGAKEMQDVETRKFRDGQQILAVGIIRLNTIRGRRDDNSLLYTQFFNNIVTEIEGALTKSDLATYVPAIRDAKQQVVVLGPVGMQQMVELLYSVQMAVSTKILSKGQTVRQSYVSLGFGLVTALSKRIQLNVLAGELRMTARRAMDGASIAIACSPLGSQYIETFLPQFQVVGRCDSAAAVAAAATTFNANTGNGPLKGMDQEFAEMQQALLDFAASQTSYKDPNYNSALGLLLAALFTAAIAAMFGFYLVVDQHRSLKEHSVVESDFVVQGSAVCIRHHTLRIVDELLLNIGTMEHCDRSAAPQQTELSIRKALNPLTMIRPFVPTYMFVRSLRSRSIFNANAKNLLKNRNLLNLTHGLRKKQAGVLFIGLRQYNVLGADVDTFNELLAAVQLACEHFQGNILQVSADGIVVVFSQGNINEDEDDEQVKDGEVLATHAAFAILELCCEQMEQEDDGQHSERRSAGGAGGAASAPGNSPIRVRRAAIPISMVVSQSHTLQGLTTFHVSRQFSLLSPGMSSALGIEPVSDLHNCPIMTTHSSASLLDGCFIVRPVHYHPTEGSVYHVMAEELPERDDDAGPAAFAAPTDARRKELGKLKEKALKWNKVWEKYEILMATERPTFEMLEESHRDLEGYKVFNMQANESDTAYETAVANVKKVAQSLGVNLGNTVEED